MTEVSSLTVNFSSPISQTSNSQSSAQQAATGALGDLAAIALSVRSDAWLKMWYYLDPSRQPQGPMEFPQLATEWKKRALNEHSLVWGEGMSEWKALSELPEIIQEIEIHS